MSPTPARFYRSFAILGIDENKFNIDSIGDFKPFIHPDDVARATAIDLDEVDALIENDERYYNEFRFVRPSGEVRLVKSVACVLVDVTTGHKRAVGCITDLTIPGDLERMSARWPMRLAPDWPPADTRQATSVQSIASSTLTDKEKMCLLWVSYGKTAAETAKITEKSRRTMEFHINDAVKKLDAANKIHAVVTGIHMGIL